MVAVVYSGSRTAFWKLTENGEVVAHCNTTGINPCFVDEKSILQILNKKIVLINNAENIKKIYFFAAGASSTERKDELAKTLSSFFRYSKVIVEDDLFGATKAACNTTTGIVGVLGSGANCAFFDGKKPVKNNFGLGYILGDEGSSNYLGKILLKKFLTHKLPNDLRTKFINTYDLERAQILERVYRKPQANIFLSSFFDFYIQNKTHGYILNLIDEGFDQHFNTYILPMVAKHPDTDLHFVGAVASEFKDRLHHTANKYDLEIRTITKDPILKLLKHYTN
ncbi:hypothetical protein EZJ43_05235 [Pedobacter changchengzhani]|uniref:N-acetylglucosamine kinase n=1 Tax=Pedobacter changchengzhani TaxID=2529274 RepID=A0A4R5MLT7_9SPHI|nr:hypothetical protein [Pedobacter changchengzhani]TDG36690.1 hypothetical protein EZJ43_05235 [Pedobacter changchengzhani]